MEEKQKIIGVMSGTSLDGVDLAELYFWEEENNVRFEIGVAETVSYAEDWVEKLKNAIHYSEGELEVLNAEYTSLLGETINQFIENHLIKDITAIASHGHTVLHQPQNGLTLQIGNLPEIARIVKHTVVCDFRVQDVELRGQGAPLVPIGDKILFSEYDYCLNLGGFSNISFDQNGQRMAYDISPVNTVLNYYANQLNFPYDDEGELARGGAFQKDLFERLNRLAFYAQKPPKSLGMEFVLQEVFPITQMYSATEVIRTFTEHIAYQISKNIHTNASKILVTGGGAYNDFLIERMRCFLPESQVIIPDKKLIEFKEALIFGLLGYLRLKNRVNVFSSVTGAKHDHSSGKIYC